MTQKLLLAIPAALSLAACGGGGDDVTNVPAQAQYSDSTIDGSRRIYFW
jgi:hypothetical protein